MAAGDMTNEELVEIIKSETDIDNLRGKCGEVACAIYLGEKYWQYLECSGISPTKVGEALGIDKNRFNDGKNVGKLGGMLFYESGGFVCGFYDILDEQLRKIRGEAPLYNNRRRRSRLTE